MSDELPSAIADREKMIADCKLAADLMDQANTFPTGVDILRDAAKALALARTEADAAVSEPYEPGGYVGDIFYGHPVKTTMGTHRWDGKQWVALPTEMEAVLGLLAQERAKRDAAVAAALERAEGIATAQEAQANKRQAEADDEAQTDFNAGVLFGTEIGARMIAREIRALITQPQSDALAAVRAEARREGMREAAQIADAHYAKGDMGNPGHYIHAALAEGTA